MLKGSANNPASPACPLLIPRWTVANMDCTLHVWNTCSLPRLRELHKLHMWNMSSTCRHAPNPHAFLVRNNSKSVYFNYLFMRKDCGGICVIFNLQKIENFIYHCAVQVVKLDANISLPSVNFTSAHLLLCRIGNSCCKMWIKTPQWELLEITQPFSHPNVALGCISTYQHYLLADI